MAVTRDGIPVRVWCWPGNTADSALIRQVKDDMRDWTLAKVVWVADRGFTSAANRRYLRQGGHGYILGEKLRSDSAEADAALSRQGRYQRRRARTCGSRKSRSPTTERFVICHNPDAAERDAAHPRAAARPTRRADRRLGHAAGDEARPSCAGVISTKPGLNRYLRVTPGGLLRIDKAAKIKTEANLDGKYLLRCSDPHLPAEDIALGYKQLLEVERGWRDMKQILDLRPVYHRLEERIRAHVVLCWLALLLIRIVETSTGAHLAPPSAATSTGSTPGTFTGPTGLFRQRTELSKPQQDLFAKLDITPPQQMIELAPASR